ncbi:MAG TPA: SRPBCC family protein [Candidatus Limnocylindrales bacterium]|jgi:uncharacterized protein YndB with AHSA1/START domain|nr:SRPBCC family protein [Candidatus Limnocylindrales bacterium]
MANADVSVTIERPVEDVFAVLTDPTLAPRWAANAIKGELLTPGPPGVGSRRRAVVKGVFGRTLESVMEVTELDPNRTLALRLVSASWGGTGRTKYTLTPVAGGTRVDWRWEMEPGGVLKPFGRPFMAVFQRLFQRDINNLKAMMESNAL